MSNHWDNLPNAKYIDAILASVRAYPSEWDASWCSVHCADWTVKWNLSYNSIQTVPQIAAWNAFHDVIRNKKMSRAWIALWGAGAALIAYDDCAYMLESDPGELAILAAFGDQRAILLLPACKALAAIKEKENV